jgi:hypothetical protein
MDIPLEVAGALQELVMPAGALGVATGLVRGAKALERDANEEALKYVSKLLLRREIGQIGNVPATLIPLVFDRIFGPNPLSIKFVSRSVIATIIFWSILLFVKHFYWSNLLREINLTILWLIPAWLLVDWVSLAKARFFLKLLPHRRPIMFSFMFFVFDLSASYVLSLLFLVLYLIVSQEIIGLINKDDFLQTIVYIWTNIQIVFLAWLNLHPFSQYINMPSENFNINFVFIPSTMLTTIWTLFLFLSSIVTQLIAPIDYLRRFMAWWFRDVDRHPLTVIAKVAATLIVIGAGVIKVVRWI